MKRVFLCLLSCGLVLAWIPSSAWGQCATPTSPATVQIIGTVGVGTTTINGVSTGMGSTSVEIIDTTGSVPRILPLQNGTIFAGVASGTHIFTAVLVDPLFGRQKLLIQELNGSTQIGCPLGFTIPVTTPTVQIIGKVVEGATTLDGVATGTNSQGMNSATVEIIDTTGGGNTVIPLQNGASSATVNSTTHVFDAMLAVPLYGGQTLMIQEYDMSSNPIGNPLPVTVAGLADWGRVRVNAAAGAVLSTDNGFAAGVSGNNAQTTLFVALEVEKNWKWVGVDRSDRLTSHVAFTTYFNGRLTSVPVSTCQSSTAVTPSGGNNGNAGGGGNAGAATGSAGAAGAATGNPPACSTDTTTAFLSSQKSAELQVGAYAPYLFKPWKWAGSSNALFVAPIAKVGFIAPVGATSAVQTTSTPTTMTVTTSQPVNPAQFYNNYSFGGRVGHFKLSRDSNLAPELLSYLDVSMGRFSNLTTLENNGTVTYPTRRWRVAVEGLLKIPATPFTLGMSANVGQNLYGLSGHTVQSAKDDLRFFIGAKFDVGKMIAKLQF